MTYLQACMRLEDSTMRFGTLIDLIGRLAGAVRGPGACPDFANAPLGLCEHSYDNYDSMPTRCQKCINAEGGRFKV